MTEKKTKRNLTEQLDKNIFEWLVFGISGLLLLATLSYLGYQTLEDSQSPPDLVVMVFPDSTKNMPYRYHLIIENKGQETASEVKTEVVLQYRDSVMEKADVILQFVPQGSKRESFVNFSTNPEHADTIIARIVSFNKP